MSYVNKYSKLYPRMDLLQRAAGGKYWRPVSIITLRSYHEQKQRMNDE